MSDLQQHSLKDLDTLVQRLGDVRMHINNHEASLKDWKAKEKALVEVAIPELMAASGTKLYGSEDGLLVEIEEQVFARISVDKKEAAHQWLRDHQEGGMIRVETKEAVHPQSLKAWVRGKRAEGVEIPEDLFGVFVKKVAKIK